MQGVDSRAPDAAGRVTDLRVRADQGGIELIDRMSPEWREMCDGCADGQPFRRPEWIRAYLKHFMPRGNVVILSVRAGGRLVSLLPLVTGRVLFSGLPARRLGAPVNLYSYRFDIACSTNETGRVAVRALWEALKELSAWDVIQFDHLPEDGMLRGLQRLAEFDGFATTCQEGLRNPFIPLTGWDGDPDWWLLRCGRHFRHTFRTAARKASAAGQISLRRVTAATENDLESFYALEASGWKGDAGTAIESQRDTRDFYTEILKTAANFGYLSMYFLDLDGHPIAAHLGLTYRQRYYALKCGYDESLAAFAPGHLIVNAILQDCAGRGLAEFEFLGTMDDWKRKWTSSYRPLGTLCILRKNVYGSCLRAAHVAEVRLRSAARGLLGAAHIGPRGRSVQKALHAPEIAVRRSTPGKSSSNAASLPNASERGPA
jgi:CelD/BcsL family acetyltransferase involved in cellulose biosynthesis